MKDKNCRPEISSKIDDFENYDVIFVGYPIWWYREPSIIDTFMEQYNFDNKIVVPFATSGGSGMGDSAKNLQELAKTAKVQNGKRWKANVSSDELKSWAEKFVK